MTAQHAPASPVRVVRAKLLSRTGDAHHIATRALSDAIAASGLSQRGLARDLACDEAYVRRMGAGLAPCTWQRLYHAPLPLRRELAGALLYGAVPASVDLASGIRIATSRLGVAASVAELALSPLGPGGAECTPEERTEILRACTALRGAVESIEAWARGGKGR